jgi:hypothetical protein
MITVRRDAPRTQAVHRRAKFNETAKQHRGLKLVFDHAEVVKCDISATANTLKSKDTLNLLPPISNIRAVTLKLYSRAPLSRGPNSSVLKVSLAAQQCQRLRSTKVSIRSRSSACSRLVSTRDLIETSPLRERRDPRDVCQWLTPSERCARDVRNLGTSGLAADAQSMRMTRSGH